jgi:hypothetical protein
MLFTGQDTSSVSECDRVDVWAWTLRTSLRNVHSVHFVDSIPLDPVSAAVHAETFNLFAMDNGEVSMRGCELSNLAPWIVGPYSKLSKRGSLPLRV